MEKSILKSITPVIVGGVHTSWTNKEGKLNYNFIVEFENGDKGQASSTNTSPKWKIGDEHSYEKEVKGNYTNIRGIKSTSFMAGGAAAKQKTPKEFGLDVARKYFNSVKGIEGAKANTFDNMIKMAGYVAGLSDKYSRTAIETAFTRAGSIAMDNGVLTPSSEIVKEVIAYDEFLKS